MDSVETIIIEIFKAIEDIKLPVAAKDGSDSTEVINTADSHIVIIDNKSVYCRDLSRGHLGEEPLKTSVYTKLSISPEFIRINKNIFKPL
jgi:hypothetical protein